MIDGNQVDRANARRVAAIVAGCILGWFVIVYGFAALLRATGARPVVGAQSILEYSLPSARDDSGRFLGYSRFDAAELNRIQQAKDPFTIRYVGPDVPSTGPDVVSVNVVDDFTWGAAALSNRTDRCYLILLVTDREGPQYTKRLFDRPPKDEPCLGASAVPERVRASDWPDFESDTLSVLENLFIGLFMLGPVAAAIAWTVAELAKVQDRGRARLRWLGPLALALVGWWMGGGAALGAVEETLNRLDAGEVAGSFVWSTLGLAVIAAGAITFAVTRRRGFEPHKALGWTGVALLLAGLPVAFLVAATSFI
ncbi:MAG: hypothetical protein M3163_12795 [Actinomycetota bacterium]|nr:hypothetical protein [Actinomycetota bacterium]